jgi:hypothetical protein
MATTEFTSGVAQLQEQALNTLKQAQDANVRALVAATAAFDPAEIVEQTYGFAGKVLELQKDYALRLAHAVSPGTTKKG